VKRVRSPPDTAIPAASTRINRCNPALSSEYSASLFPRTSGYALKWIRAAG
jgi:hypothetical protein